MLECWRWFGPLDRITLPEIAQTGARGIVTALHEVPYGEVWTAQAIVARQALIADAGVGLHWAVVESLPVHERIKRGEGDLTELFANYCASLQNLAQAGVHTICYNFMTVIDWVRTDHAMPMRGGGLALGFDAGRMAGFERHLLGRDIEAEYPPEAIAAGDRWFAASTEKDRADLLSNIMAGLPGAYERFTVAGLRAELARYHGLTADDLRANLGRFLDAIVPTAERLGMRLAIHPDDPPRPVFGLARIVSSGDDLDWILNRSDSPANGLTFCSGALGANPANDLPGIARRHAGRIHFVHLRSVARSPDGSFHEAAHLEGDGDLVRLVPVLLGEEARRESELPFRPDHGHVLLSDADRDTHPGYPLIGRLRGLGELRGVIAASHVVRFEARCAALIAELGLADGILGAVPLSGGVASDIARVDLDTGPVCVKFALPKLKVVDDWFAPVHRNGAEYAWLAFAAEISPASVPRLLGRSEALNGFAMEYLAGEGVYLWKAALLAGRMPRGEAAQVADVLGRIHAHSARPGFDAAAFRNRDDFRAIRLEPYLTRTATRHPDLASALSALTERLFAADIALVHGDISPKNILIRDGAPVILDAECATMGDPVFDVAFCLNHLVLKAIHLPAMAESYHSEAIDFWRSYARHVTWEAPADLEARLLRLLPALMLARVDGASPVEYLAAAARDRVRVLARALIIEPAPDLATLLTCIAEESETA